MTVQLTWDHVEAVTMPVEPGTRLYLAPTSGRIMTPCRVLSCRLTETGWKLWFCQVQLEDGREIEVDEASLYAANDPFSFVDEPPRPPLPPLTDEQTARMVVFRCTACTEVVSIGDDPANYDDWLQQQIEVYGWTRGPKGLICSDCSHPGDPKGRG